MSVHTHISSVHTHTWFMHSIPQFLTTLMAQLQIVITSSILIQIRQTLYSSWSPGCLISNETTFTQKLFVDQKLWSKKWANFIFQYWFQSDLSTFDLWLPQHYCELFNYPWLTYVKLFIGARDQNVFTNTKWGVYNSKNTSPSRI